MFREIKVKEIRKDKKEEEKGYLKIKPEKELTDEELKAFWMEEFQKASLEG